MEWQPIETATEGQSVLVFDDVSGISRAILDDEEWLAEASNTEWAYRSDGYIVRLCPTHWMPFPVPPASPTEKINYTPE